MTTKFSMTADNTNYAAEIVEVKNLTTLEGLDNLRGLPIGGYQALVPRNTPLGEYMVVFPAESQIEDWFVASANLYRHAEKNANPEVVGYIEDNRRVRAIRLRGHASNSLAMSWTEFVRAAGLVPGLVPPAPGTLFDTVDDRVLLVKYEVPVKAGNLNGNQPKTNKFKAINLPEHYDTENWWRNEFKISDDTIVTVSQKLHGTSVRAGNILVDREPTWFERVLVRLGIAEYV